MALVSGVRNLWVPLLGGCGSSRLSCLSLKTLTKAGGWASSSFKWPLTGASVPCYVSLSQGCSLCDIPQSKWSKSERKGVRESYQDGNHSTNFRIDMVAFLPYSMGHTDHPWYNTGRNYTRVWTPGDKDHLEHHGVWLPWKVRELIWTIFWYKWIIYKDELESHVFALSIYIKA